jgi:hypothetical protein
MIGLSRYDAIEQTRARQRFGVLQPSGAFRRPEDARKRRRAGALQDAAALLSFPCINDHPVITRLVGKGQGPPALLRGQISNEVQTIIFVAQDCRGEALWNEPLRCARKRRRAAALQNAVASPAGHAHFGSRSTKHAPSFVAVSSVIAPPRAVARRRHKARPRPTPGAECAA